MNEQNNAFNENVPNTTDANKQFVSKCLIVSIIVGGTLLLIMWIALMLCCKKFSIFGGDLPGMISALTLLGTAICTVKAVKAGVLNKGGTKYYNKKYGEKTISTIINDNRAYLKHKNNFPYITDKIQELLSVYYDNGQEENNFNNLYFKYVYQLQASDHEFNMVWNDYNYFDAIQKKSSNDKSYLNKLKSYIFCNVHEQSKIDTHKADK